MNKNECVAIILAGGKGERLGSLTTHIAKPVVSYGGKHRFIDFTLSNCIHSGIEIAGILTQHNSLSVAEYIQGFAATLNKKIAILPSSQAKGVYTGTANAVYQNLKFIENYQPEHLLVLSSDHIYKMDYSKMLLFHKTQNADITISVLPMPAGQVNLFSIAELDRKKRVINFLEKPKKSKNNLSSMGIYLFKWSSLKSYLGDDEAHEISSHDFGKDIIPAALKNGEKIFAYQHKEYWRDVGTLRALWESNMDLLRIPPPIDISGAHWNILTGAERPLPLSSVYSYNTEHQQRGGSLVYGKLKNSIISNSVVVGKNARIINSVLMPGAVVDKGATVIKTIVGNNAYIGKGSVIGEDSGTSKFKNTTICADGISLVAPGIYIGSGLHIGPSSHIEGNVISAYDL